jgi:hypothetical protein
MSDQRTEARVRLLIRIPAKLKAKIAEIAQRERRSINKQIEFLLDQSIREETRGDVSASGKKARHE